MDGSGQASKNSKHFFFNFKGIDLYFLNNTHDTIIWTLHMWLFLLQLRKFNKLIITCILLQ